MGIPFLGASGTRVFSGPLWVHYGQAYVVVGSWDTDLAASFRGQVNGLHGAAAPGLLFLITGHTGRVGFTVDVCTSPPPIDDSWEEIVEVPFIVTVPEVTLEEWPGRPPTRCRCPPEITEPGTVRAACRTAVTWTPAKTLVSPPIPTHSPSGPPHPHPTR